MLTDRSKEGSEGRDGGLERRGKWKENRPDGTMGGLVIVIMTGALPKSEEASKW